MHIYSHDHVFDMVINATSYLCCSGDRICFIVGGKIGGLGLLKDSKLTIVTVRQTRMVNTTYLRADDK